MKKTQLFYFIGIVLIAIVIFFCIPKQYTIASPRLVNTDSIAPRHLLRDYQIDIVDEHTINVYDGERFIGSMPFDEDYEHPTYLDNIIILDNQ